MKFLVRYALVVLASAFACSAHAGAIDELRSFAQTTKAARGEFTQRVIRNGRASPPSTGDFVFARPGRFRWAYEQPFEQLLIADGDRLWIWDKDLNQVTIKKLGSALGESPAAILFGNNDLEKSFVLEEAGTRDGVAWLDATPRSKDTNFNKVSIGFRNGLPVAMELHDAFGQISRLEFNNVVSNPNVPADRFRFVPPKGADVYEQ
ncbi:MAG TPA: outer membrane lipoprotein chaperone LolA [Burkholderiaceae bacterium]|nr:outer membrane lipoprotein chaperone LolA [Burkholderiaceae bacterium]